MPHLAGLNSVNIIGAGSVGHLWAGYLSAKGHQVSLVSRSAKKDQTVSLKTPHRQIEYIARYVNFDQLPPADLTLITLKAGALERVCKILAHSDHVPTNAILIMNGMGLIELVQRLLPEAEVYQASMTHGANFQASPSASGHPVIHHTGSGETVIGQLLPTGSLAASHPSHFIQSAIGQLNHALPPVKWNENHQQTLWTKLIVNSIINPLTTIHNVPNGALIDDPQLYKQARILTEELEPLLNHYLSNVTPQQMFNKIELIASKTSKNSSSMRQDIHRGRKTEIDFISGYILKKANKYGWSLPEHQKLNDQVRNMELQILNSVTK